MNALFTGKGDDGKTNTYGCNQRMSKSSNIAEALGALDEANSFLGICKIKSQEKNLEVYDGLALHILVHGIQEHLFKIQAEVAGFPMKIEESKVKDLESVIAAIEKELPPIKTFFISGGTLLAANFDFARTLARRAERRLVAVSEEGKVAIGAETLRYMNRLSSILYALARLTNHKSGINEESPKYN